jgi:hypothetical protein
LPERSACFGSRVSEVQILSHRPVISVTYKRSDSSDLFLFVVLVEILSDLCSYRCLTRLRYAPPDQSCNLNDLGHILHMDILPKTC